MAPFEAATKFCIEQLNHTRFVKSINMLIDKLLHNSPSPFWLKTRIRLAVIEI